jgi:hypothetical protein
MANNSTRFGARPIKMIDGTPYNGGFNIYWAPATYATNLFLGDPVVHNGDSNDTEVMGHGPGSIQEVILATAGDGVAITGFIVGFDLITRDSPLYGPASTDRIIQVCDNPDVIFEMRDDGGGTPTVDWAGWNANLISGTGNTSTGLSGWGIDGGTSDGPAADASNQLLIRNLSPKIDNEMGDYGIWEVLINQHTSKPHSGLGID